MKAAISVTEPRLDAALDTQFGRSAAFVLVDTETGEWQGYANPATDATGGAGVQAAEFLVEKGAQAAISSAFGPKAQDVLSAADVDLYKAATGTAADLVRKLKEGTLEPVEGSLSGGGRRGAGRSHGRRR